MISSKANSKIKNVVALQKHSKTRKEQKAFVVEGLKMFEELPREKIKEVYATEAFASKYESLLAGMVVEIVDEKIFELMSDTKTPQGVLCVAKQMDYELTELLEKPETFLLILEDLQDPGNVGTIFRTAEGAGVDGIILSENCVDIYNPKTTRATMGSIYRIPFLYTDDMGAVLKELEKKKITTYAAHLQAKTAYDQEDYQKGSAFLIGNEGKGLSKELTKVAKKLIKIPMAGEVESLNAAVAATVLMYEGNRQRRRET